MLGIKSIPKRDMSEGQHSNNYFSACSEESGILSEPIEDDHDLSSKDPRPSNWGRPIIGNVDMRLVLQCVYIYRIEYNA